MTTYSVLHYALLSPDRQPQPCSQEQWRAWVDSLRYTPVLVREHLDDWEVDLTFTGTWAGRGTPKFFSLWISAPDRSSTLRQFVTYEQAWRALGRVLAKCWLRKRRKAGP
jgi:hypothetical protein